MGGKVKKRDQLQEVPEMTSPPTPTYPAGKADRGLYSPLFQEKKIPFLADFIKNKALFIKNSILTIFTDPKVKRSENAR